MASPIESTDLYLRARALGREVWGLVILWDTFARRTVGEQLVRSMDSVSANIVEGDGRGSDKDAARFFTISRASAREARHWLDVASERDLVASEQARAMLEELTSVVKMLNGLIAYRRSSVVKEERGLYDASENEHPYSPRDA